MQDGKDAGRSGVIAWLRREFDTLQLASFLPVLTLIAYWIHVDAVLFVVSFLFPILFVLQDLNRPAQPVAAPPAAEPEDVPERDSLTGLATRQEAVARLEGYITSERTTGRITAVLLFDIDNFHKANERFGIEAGDAALATLATRLTAAVRGKDLVARMDGDSFAVILAPVRRADLESVVAVAERVMAGVAQPLQAGGHRLHLTCSAGICLMGRAPENTALSMLQSAEVALIEARQAGEGTIRSFSPRMRREQRKRSTLSAELDAALENGQIRPWFQPQICTDTGRITGFEALARWEHPEEGVLAPGRFLSIVEAASRTERLGEVVLYHSLSALRSWDKAGLDVPNVGVNFATDELRNPRLCEKIKWEVDRFDLAPERLTIEILETVVAEPEDDSISRNIHGLAAMGAAIDLDDFGTGHAAIANIRRFGVNRIKIDRSFVRGVDQDSEQQLMIAAIVRMAECLDISALAEGVETLAEQSMLAQLGCRYIQGYGLARPMPFGDTIAWIHKHNEKLSPGPDIGRRAG